MRKQNKKGFTIVELVIVIAVIAILVAVLVPTFVTLVRKAQVSNDRQLVKNLNTALQTESQSKEAPKTMQAALDIAAEYGYDVTKINAKASDNEILWDSLNNVYCYFDKDGGVEYIPEAPKAKDTTPVDYWVISDKVSDTYSTYYTGTAANVPEELTKGFDAGKVEGITALKYVGTGSAQTVVIRTNAGTTLTINAPSDTVNHYNDLDELTVTAVADASYHEHGTIKGKAVISQGHIEIAEGAKVPQVFVALTEGVTEAKNVKVTAKEETLVSVDTAYAEKAAVVAESENVYVTGIAAEKISGSQASNVEMPTVVTTEAELAAAIAAEKAFIQLGASFTAADVYVINVETLIDFAGYTITATKVGTTQVAYSAAITAMTEGFVFNNTPFLTNNSKLTLTNTKEEGGIASSNNIVILNTSSLTINGISVSSSLQLHKYMSGTGSKKTGDLLNDDQKAYRIALNATIKRGVIRNEATGKLLISSVTLYTKSDYGVLNYGEATIDGGTFTSDSSSANGGYAYCVTNDNIMTINGGTVLGDHGAIAGNAGSLVINNVTAKAKQFYAVYAAGEVDAASAVINNGVFESEKQSAVLIGNSSDGGNGLPANVTINNGTFKGSTVSGSNAAVRTSTVKGGGTYGLGFVTINGGKFNTDVSNATGVNTCEQVDGLWVVNK